MASSQGTSVRSRQVSAELRRLREEAGLTGAEVAETLGMSASKLSRIETGNRGLHLDDVAALLALYRVPELRRDEILALVTKSGDQGWWHSPGSGLPDLWKELIDFESRAIRIQNYELALVPGLLQTAEYAGAVISGINPAITEAELDTLVASRMARQALLRRRSLKYLAVVDETALHRVIGDGGVMRRQLRQLGTAAEHPNVTVRVVPLGAGANAGLRGPFVLMDFAGEPSLVHIENQGIGLFLEEPEDLADYRLALGGILDDALAPADSVELIFSVADRI
ncbi:helix-turn-helix domain-containing protein [Amycolatopsis anabasis]|uniref:helix-turn-helix domain-containing protein n=1 Tax=Amycolatopsis anabasis TaxID=1840409 RepID=UPI00131E4855|nr:helix-turn-helix transcriptional regulator [Amycolatopsis anabasis]